MYDVKNFKTHAVGVISINILVLSSSLKRDRLRMFNVTVLWNLTPCNVVEVQRFGGTSYFHIQTLKWTAADSFQSLVNFCCTTQHRISGDGDHHNDHHKNLRSHNSIFRVPVMSRGLPEL